MIILVAFHIPAVTGQCTVADCFVDVRYDLTSVVLEDVGGVFLHDFLDGFLDGFYSIKGNCNCTLENVMISGHKLHKFHKFHNGYFCVDIIKFRSVGIPV